MKRFHVLVLFEFLEIHFQLVIVLSQLFLRKKIKVCFLIGQPFEFSYIIGGKWLFSNDVRCILPTKKQTLQYLVSLYSVCELQSLKWMGWLISTNKMKEFFSIDHWKYPMGYALITLKKKWKKFKSYWHDGERIFYWVFQQQDWGRLIEN